MNKSRTLLLTLLTVTATLLVPNITQVHAVNTFQKCDVFTGVGGGQINWYRPNDCPGIPSAVTFQGTLQATGFSDSVMTGMSFDVNGGCATIGQPCLYATTFNANTAVVFDVTGAYLGTCGGVGNLDTAGNSDVESAVVVPGYSGGPSVFFGQADGDQHILRYPLPCTPTSTLQDSFAVSTGPRGTDWVDMSSDLCNMHYTSEGTKIRSFNVCTSTQNPDFATALPGSSGFAHRILSDGSELVADNAFVVHVSNTGANINTCISSAAGGGILFSMDILPDQNAFAAAIIGGSNAVSYQTVAACDAGTAASAFSFTGIQSGQTDCGACIIGGTAIYGEFTSSNPPPQGMHVSKFFTDSSLNPLPLDSKGNSKADVVLAHGIVKSTNPGQILAWVNVTNTSGSSVQSLKLNETLPVDWKVNPAWKPALGAIHVYFANTNSLLSNPEITQPSTITVSSGNPQTVQLAIPSFNATAIGHPLMPGQSILLSVKLTYGLIGTSQPASSYPRNYTDTAVTVAWTQASFTGTESTGSGSAFFTADAKVVS